MKRINVTCSSDQNPHRLACEYKPRVEWAYLVNHTIVASCRDFTVTFVCTDGDDDTRQYTRQNILVGLGFYANTMDVPEEIIDNLANGGSCRIEWPKIADLTNGDTDAYTIDRSQQPILKRVN